MSKKSFLVIKNSLSFDEMAEVVDWLYDNLKDRYDVGAGIITFFADEDATLFCLKFKGKITFREIIKND